jgi:hypothetical protein
MRILLLITGRNRADTQVRTVRDQEVNNPPGWIKPYFVGENNALYQ